MGKTGCAGHGCPWHEAQVAERTGYFRSWGLSAVPPACWPRQPLTQAGHSLGLFGNYTGGQSGARSLSLASQAVAYSANLLVTSLGAAWHF